MKHLTFLILVLTVNSVVASSECYTCISVNGEGCGNDFVLQSEKKMQCGYESTPSATKLLRVLLPNINEIFTVWPPSGNADCLKTNVKISGRDYVIRSCTNLGESTCSQFRSAVVNAGGSMLLTDCFVCSGDACNHSSIIRTSSFQTILLMITIIFLIVNFNLM